MKKKEELKMLMDEIQRNVPIIRSNPVFCGIELRKHWKKLPSKYQLMLIEIAWDSIAKAENIDKGRPLKI